MPHLPHPLTEALVLLTGHEAGSDRRPARAHVQHAVRHSVAVKPGQEEETHP